MASRTTIPFLTIFIAVAAYLWYKKSIVKILSGWVKYPCDVQNIMYNPTGKKDLLVTMYKPFVTNKKSSIMIFYNEKPKYQSFLTKLAFHGNMIIYSFPFKKTELSKLEHVREFLDWAIVDITNKYECNFNKLYVGGDELGGLISSLLLLMVKNDFIIMPGIRAQVLVNPIMFQYKKKYESKLFKKFNFTDRVQTFIENNYQQEHTERFWHPYRSTIIFTNKLSKVKEYQSFLDLLEGGDAEKAELVEVIGDFDDRVFTQFDPKWFE